MGYYTDHKISVLYGGVDIDDLAQRLEDMTGYRTLQRFLAVLDKLGLRDRTQMTANKYAMYMPSWWFPELDVLSPELYDYLQRVKKSRKKGRVNRVD